MAALPTGYGIRRARVQDAAVLARQRRAMFDAMGSLARVGDGDALEESSREWIARELERGTFYSWVAEFRGADVGREIVAGGGLQVRQLMPRPGHATGGEEGLVLSVWTDVGHRRRGLAQAVVEEILAWCRERGIRRVTLHASEDGRRIYERLGFKQTNEMRLEL
jgi:GNAT superfamily N-acetyltransferase